MRFARGQGGQATVELVALLPCLAALCAALWQVVLAGHASWAATAAARAAVRAEAVGGDAEAAARARLPGSLERGLSVRTSRRDGVVVRVTVSVRVPALPGLPSLGRVTAGATFAEQG